MRIQRLSSSNTLGSEEVESIINKLSILTGRSFISAFLTGNSVILLTKDDGNSIRGMEYFIETGVVSQMISFDIVDGIIFRLSLKGDRVTVGDCEGKHLFSYPPRMLCRVYNETIHIQMPKTNLFVLYTKKGNMLDLPAMDLWKGVSVSKRLYAVRDKGTRLMAIFDTENCCLCTDFVFMSVTDKGMMDCIIKLGEKPIY